MDLEAIKKLCALMREEDLVELTVEEEGRRITLRRAAGPRAPLEAPLTKKEGIIVRSPVVGTFWIRPAPGEPPFVKVGDFVQPGQVLCIVEAMKVMNEVRAEVAGVVEEILVEEGEAVEYGQPLFRLRPA
ncbi:acetyl-CoA carboxylase biotin carboxyl carrier protein [Candidatus Bipolaricaulota bacterium]|nr:acetyl-CoA carboxylase biotin carboxyl carrier protein [Candidatus Bipolaricaulota bacterium]